MHHKSIPQCVANDIIRCFLFRLVPTAFPIPIPPLGATWPDPIQLGSCTSSKKHHDSTWSDQIGGPNFLHSARGDPTRPESNGLDSLRPVRQQIFRGAGGARGRRARSSWSNASASSPHATLSRSASRRPPVPSIYSRSLPSPPLRHSLLSSSPFPSRSSS